MDDLLADFIVETRETLEAIAGELVSWEGDPSDRSRLDGIFRFVHTVKGSCGFLDLPRLARLSHAAEDALADVRSGTRVADSRLVNAVLAIIDRIGELTDAIESGGSLPDGEDGVLIAALAPGADPEPAPTATTGTITNRSVSRSIRLPVDLLDRMMAGVSDMVLARNELSRSLRERDSSPATEVAFERLSQCVAEIRDAITRTRMARIDGLFSALPRMVRDLANQLGRAVQLDVDGGDVELDREMIEMIRDPLTHIVRNAIDHGLEPREERIASGKPPAGRLRIAARQSGNQILIDAIDDGRGIDVDRLAAKAIASGVITADQAAAMSHAAKLQLVFSAGLSTAANVTSVSGRGVGMDVVRANIERIGGTVDVDSRLGAGVRLSMRVPLTLTIIPALIVGCGDQRFAVPRSAIDEIVRPNGDSVRLQRLAGRQIAFVRGRNLPVIELGPFLDCASPDAANRPPVLVVLRAAAGERLALLVEAVLDHEELVVKPAAPAVMSTGIYAGTTLPDNSRPLLLLDVTGLAAASGITAAEEELAVEREPVEQDTDPRMPVLLFRDLDGVERGVHLGLVERIEDLAREQVAESGGRLRLAHQDALIPVVATAPIGDATRMRFLQLGDGATRLAYAVAAVFDVVDAPTAVTPAGAPGPVAGVLLVDGRQVELLDSHWLFANAVNPPPARRPVCLLAGDDPWTRQVLAPLLATAGYELRFGGAGDEEGIDVVVAPGVDAPLPTGGAPVVRLRPTPEAHADERETIWRYDRTGLLDAVKAAAGRRG